MGDQQTHFTDIHELAENTQAQTQICAVKESEGWNRNSGRHLYWFTSSKNHTMN